MTAVFILLTGIIILISFGILVFELSISRVRALFEKRFGWKYVTDAASLPIADATVYVLVYRLWAGVPTYHVKRAFDARLWLSVGDRWQYIISPTEE